MNAKLSWICLQKQVRKLNLKTNKDTLPEQLQNPVENRRKRQK
jgi:hypothetical protein